MVKETRHIIDVGDIRAVRLVCNYRQKDTEQPCDGEAIYPFGERKGWQWVCPKCGSEWKTTFPANMPPEMRTVSRPEAAALGLLQNVETLLDAACAPFSIRFEIEAEQGENA